MVKAAHSQQLQQLFETHLEETEAQIERLEECFGILDIQPRAKACKGMMGIVEEGEEVMAEGKKKDETAADLALIGAAQKVEHYEMSGYITARNLAQQLHMAPIVQLLQLSLGEEEDARKAEVMGAAMLSRSAKEFEEFARICVSSDPPELREKLLNLTREWMRAVNASRGPCRVPPCWPPRGCWFRAASLLSRARCPEATTTPAPQPPDREKRLRTAVGEPA
jgi:ferritin-like metal-binding protein YciE